MTLSKISTFLFLSFAISNFAFSQEIDYSKPIDNKRCTKLAIENFDCPDCASSDKQLASILRQEVENELTSYKYCDLLERERITQLLQWNVLENEIRSLQDLTDAEKLTLVNSEEAENILFGKIIVQGDGSILLTLQITNLRSTLKKNSMIEIPDTIYNVHSKRLPFIEKTVHDLLSVKKQSRKETKEVVVKQSPEQTNEITVTPSVIEDLLIVSISEGAPPYDVELFKKSKSGEISSAKKYHYSDNGIYKINIAAFRENMPGKYILITIDSLENKSTNHIDILDYKIVTIQDKANNNYKAKKIGNKTWMLEDLKFIEDGDIMTWRAYKTEDGNIYYNYKAAREYCQNLEPGTWQLPTITQYKSIFEATGDQKRKIILDLQYNGSFIYQLGQSNKGNLGQYWALDAEILITTPNSNTTSVQKALNNGAGTYLSVRCIRDH